MKWKTIRALALAALLGAGGCLWPKPSAEESPQPGAEAGGERDLPAADSKGRRLPPPDLKAHGFREMKDMEELERQRSKSVGGLRLVASLDREEYDLEQPVVVDVRVWNVTGGRAGEKAKDIHTYFEPFAQMPKGGRGEWLFKFRIQRESDGKVIYVSPKFPVSKKDRAKYYHYVTLPEQSWIGRGFELPKPSRNNWLEPGETYSLHVTYTVDDAYPLVIINRFLTAAQVQALGLKLAYVRVWTGTLHARPILFRVKSKKKRFLFF